MTKENKKILFSQVEPSSDLLGRIFLNIELEKEKNAKRGAFVFGIVSIFSFFTALFSGIYFVQEFYNSGTYDYVSLLFSDFEMIGYFWRELLVSVAESMPIFWATVVLASLVAFLNFLKETIRNILNISGLKIRTV